MNVFIVWARYMSNSLGCNLSTGCGGSLKIICQRALSTSAQSSSTQWSAIKRRGHRAVVESVNCAFISPPAESLHSCQGSLCAFLSAWIAAQECKSANKQRI